MTPLERRIAALEASKRAMRPIPPTIFVGMDETQAEAAMRYAEEWPNRPHNRSPLIVPAKPRTDAERTVWAERFRAQQRRLVADARSERGAAPSAPETITPREWPTSPAIRPNGPHVVWRPFL